MNSTILRWLALILLLLPLTAAAETLVLVQGWLGSGDNWRTSGITGMLEEAGWVDGGDLSLDPQGVEVSGAQPSGIRRFYTLDLPTATPLWTQERQLTRYMQWIQSQYPEESIVLAGHSAGGVLARLYMVEHPDAPVSALITFVSPHLGAESARFGAEFGRTLLEWLEPYVGSAVLEHLLGLFRDLAPARFSNGASNFLGWLNHQPHPQATYISVIRREDSGYGFGDLLVPAWSQDMNRVYALRGRVRTVEVDGLHGLSLADGKLLVRLLYSLRTAGLDIVIIPIG